MKPRIALKLLLAFLLALLAFALVSSLLFSSLFTQAVIKNKRQDMQHRANTLATALSQAMAQPGKGGRGQGGFGEVVRLMTLAQDNIWVLDENLAFLSAGRMSGRTLSYKELPPDAGQLVQQVFEGRQPFSEGFSEMMGYPSLTIGVPIIKDGQVAGALLMHDAVSGIQDAAREGQRILMVAGGLALVLALLLAGLLSYSLTRPIKRMQAVALQLTGGDYTARTGIHLQDEMGELAAAIDQLSQRLEEARDIGERQEQQRRDFLASVAHELRTPLTVLRGSLEALQDRVVTAPEKVDSYHRQMLLEVQNTQLLVNDLLELAKLQNPDFIMEMNPLSLLLVVEDALRSARQLAQAKDIHISLENKAAPAVFPGDSARLKQMLMVVLDNAIKFSDSGTQVAVLLDEHSLQIIDQGPGISPKDLPQLFNRFYTKRERRNEGGSGLGLAIAQQIARRHGMDIQVTSQIGQGTRVVFSW